MRINQIYLLFVAYFARMMRQNQRPKIFIFICPQTYRNQVWSIKSYICIKIQICTVKPLLMNTSSLWTDSSPMDWFLHEIPPSNVNMFFWPHSFFFLLKQQEKQYQRVACNKIKFFVAIERSPNSNHLDEQEIEADFLGSFLRFTENHAPTL